MLVRMILLASLFLPAFTAAPGGDEPVRSTVKAEGLSLEVYNFAALQPLLEKDNDTTYVVNFWATWCAPCVKELPHFDRLQAHFADGKLQVILVSLDFRKHIATGLIPFILKNKVRSRVVVLDDPDANAWIDRVSPEWGGAIPATLIYRGSKREFYDKSFTYEELESAATHLLEGT